MSSSTIVSTHTNVTGTIVAPTTEVDTALQKVVAKERRTKKTKRDPDAPKRPMGAYMLWLQDNRQSIAEEYCDELTGKDRVTSTAKKAGALWKAMTDEEKESFVTKAADLRDEYRVKMADYKPAEGAKAIRIKYDADEIPETPEGWSGAFNAHYLKGKVKGIDGKTVRIQKVFTTAVEMALEINAAWESSCEKEDVPSHWSENSKPCSGITKTSTGYDLRFGADLLIQKKEWGLGGGIASWVIGKYEAPTAMTVDDVYAASTEDESDGAKEPKKAKKSPKKAKKSPKTEKKSPKKAKKSPKKESPEAKEESPEAKEEKPKKKVKKMVKKTNKSKYPEADLDEIEIEKDGKDVALMMHEDSGEVFEKGNLMEPVGKVDDGEIMFF